MNLDEKYIDQLKNIDFKPIFIMGVHRSGTSILYKILSKTGSFNSVNAYNVINYDQLLNNHINKIEGKEKQKLNNLLKKLQKSRSIDKLEIDSDFAEEYGFVLSRKNNESELKPSTLETFITLCKKIQFISENDKPILLKNPFDFNNFLFIKKQFPDAKFIFIHRNPFKTLNSQINATRTLIKNKSEYLNLISVNYPKIYKNKLLLLYYRFLYSKYVQFGTLLFIKNLARKTKYFLENIEKLDNIDYISIRYEDLCNNPDEKINNILNFLQIKAQKNIKYNNLINARKTQILKELQKKEKYIIKKINPYFLKYSYL